METTEQESSLSLENNFSDTEGKEHETTLEEPDSEDADSDTEPAELSSVSNENEYCDEVTLSVNFGLAIPNLEDDDSVSAVEKSKKRPKKCLPNAVFEAPKAQGYYHIEYNLLPHDPEPTKVDLVMFGLAAKLYKGNRSKVLKPWIEGDKTWLTWSQTVRLKVTKDILIRLVHHKVTFRVWDAKEHVSAIAKHDRPKAFRLPTDRDDEGSEQCGTKNMVMKLRDSLKQIREVVPAELRRMSDLTCAAELKMSNTEVQANESAGSPSGVTQEQQHTCPRPADQGEEQESMLADSRPTQDQDRDSKQFSQKIVPVHVSKRYNLRKNTVFKASLANSEYIRKNGAATTELSFIYLLAGEMSLAGSLLTHSKGVLDGICNISLDRPLISGDMKTLLNPLVITIRSATSLPSTPVSYDELEESCLPVYCQYKFHNTEVHRTKGYEHSSNIYFQDVSVIFTGLISHGELVEYLRGPPLEIEVHDRDRKADTCPKSTDVFGCSPQDNLLSSVALISSRRITHNPFQSVKAPHPHGIARLSFAELLSGQRSLRYKLPICCSAPLQVLGQDRAAWEGKMLEVAGTRDEPQADCLPMGHYLEANSQLNVQVKIACPLDAEAIAVPGEEWPFGRIVHLVKYDNSAALTKLRSEILRANAAAFRLRSETEEAMQRALACYKVSTREIESKEMDFLTGFHLMDKNTHLFVIEGLKDRAIRKLWEMSSTKEQISTLYNSALGFSKRLYDCLDLSFCPIHLHEPLAAIMGRPLVYVRDMVPQACFQGLSCVSQLCQISSMTVAVRSNLFPTCDMVVSLSKEFGSLPEKGQRVLEGLCQSAHEAPQKPRAGARPRPPIENYNQEFVRRKQLVAYQQLCGETPDFVQANIEKVQRASLRAANTKPAVVVADVGEGRAAHNYSSQTMNTTEQAKELLRKEMAKAPLQRFTYSQDFLSATFEPHDVAAERKAAEARSRRAWRCPSGFMCPGFQSSIESNQHARTPDEARIEELRKPWKENVLHGNTLRPTLSRGTWPWERHSEDFELYVKPPPVFPPEPPVTIHLAGELLKQEQRAAAHAQYSRWRRKILPDRNNPDSSRVPQFKTHLKKDGLDRRGSILKDRPQKYTLAKARKTVGAVSASLALKAADEEKQRRTPRVTHGPDADGDQNQSQDGSNVPHHSPQCNNKTFQSYWRPHTFLHKRTALPLRDEELKVHRFHSRRDEPASTSASPSPSAPAQPTAVQTQPARTVTETRTHRAVVLHLH